MTEMIDSFTVRPKSQTQLTIFRSTERQGATALRSHISRRHAQIHQGSQGALGGGKRQVVRGTQRCSCAIEDHNRPVIVDVSRHVDNAIGADRVAMQHPGPSLRHVVWHGRRDGASPDQGFQRGPGQVYKRQRFP